MFRSAKIRCGYFVWSESWKAFLVSTRRNHGSVHGIWYCQFISKKHNHSQCSHGKNPKQYLLESHHHEFAAIVIGGSLLSFNAGFINVVSLLISDILVSHTTGNISKSSVSFANGDWTKFVEITIMLPCFILGSFITTMLIEDSTFHLTKKYYSVLLVGTLLLALAAFVGSLTFESQLYAYLATIACGMQNALTTKYSGRSVLNPFYSACLYL